MLSRAGFKPRVEEFEPRIVPAGLWADAVVDFSSEYSSVYNGAADYWDADQALGEPNTMSYGDIVTAWAPLPMNSGGDHDRFEHLTVRFANPVNATGVMIRETYGNGFVYQVDFLFIDTNSTQTVVHTWTGVDPSQPGSPVDFTISIPATSTPVNAVKIYVDIDHDLNAWEEIDAVQLWDGSNTAPTFTSGGGVGVTVDEDSGAYSAIWANNVSTGPANEGQTPTFTVSNDNGSLFSVAPSIAADGTLSFTPAANAFGSATVTVSLSDGIDSTTPVTFTITVNAVNDAPVITPFGDMDYVEGQVVNLPISAYDVDGDAIAFEAFDLPDGLTLTDYYNGTALISGTVQAHPGNGPSQLYPVKIRASDGTHIDDVDPFCRIFNFALSTATITIPAGFTGLGVAPIAFTVTYTGVGGIAGRNFRWSVYDNDWFIDPDDQLQNERLQVITLTGAADGAWTATTTFWLHLNTDTYVAGADGHAGQTVAEVYVHVEAEFGRDLGYSNTVNVF